MPYDLDTPESISVPQPTQVTEDQFRLKSLHIEYDVSDETPASYRIVVSKGDDGPPYVEYEIESIDLVGTNPSLVDELDNAPPDATVVEVVRNHVWRVLEAEGLVPAGSTS